MEIKIYIMSFPRSLGRVAKTVQTFTQVREFIAGQAAQLNYGIWRQWTAEGYTYFDCGPVTYFVDARDYNDTL